MEISQKQLKKFIDNYREKFGVVLSEKEALEKATELIKLYKALYGSPYDKE